MNDDELFDRSMAALGVEPLDGSNPGSLAAQRDRERELDDQQLFEKAMRELDAPRPTAARRRPAKPPRVQRLKSRPKNLRVDDQIDLHGMRTEPALRRLEGFVAHASASGLRTILVITGKGHHSPGGRGILRQRVEEWVRGRSRRYVRTWSEAPARLGGRGAFVLYLRASAG